MRRRHEAVSREALRVRSVGSLLHCRRLERYRAEMLLVCCVVSIAMAASSWGFCCEIKHP